MIQDILSDIKAIKQGLLNKAFLFLLNRPHMKDWYREFGEGSFDSFCLDSYRFLEREDESAQIMSGALIGQPVDKKYHPPEMYSQIIEKSKMITQSMLQVDYEPPLTNNKNSFIMHLHLMWHLYETGISWPPSIEGMCLDLSFAKLLSAAHRRIASDLTKDELNEPRNVKPRRTKRKKAEAWQQFVLAIYEHGEPIAPGTRLSNVLIKIIDQFNQAKGHKDAPWGEIPKNMGTPGRDIINDFLKDKGIRQKDFEQKGRYWFKRT